MYYCMYVLLYVGNENYTGIAARDTANALAVLAHAVRGVAAGTKNPLHCTAGTIILQFTEVSR